MVRAARVLVVGGGVCGLAAAEHLARAGREVVCLDAGATAGGVVRTEQRAGYLLEQGPFNVLCRAPEFAALLAELGDEAPALPVDGRAGRTRFVLRGGRLHRVPRGPGELLRSELVGARGALRLARGLAFSRPAGPAATLDQVARTRFGPRVADDLLGALTVGVWGVESDELEAASAIPLLGRLDASGRSPLARLGRWRSRRAAASGAAPPVRGMISFRCGLGELVGALARRLGERLVPGATVVALEPLEPLGGARAARWRATTASGAVFEARDVVLALGAPPAAGLLEGASPALAAELRAIDHASLTVLNLGFAEGAFARRPEGYGFLVARSDRSEPVLGVLHASTVFPHQAPAGRVLVRVFFGGTRHPELAAAPEPELLGHALDALRRHDGLGADAVPELVDLARWPGAVPVYRPGHAARVARLREHEQRASGLLLAGTYLDGISVNDCVARGVRAARRILAA